VAKRKTSKKTPKKKTSRKALKKKASKKTPKKGAAARQGTSRRVEDPAWLVSPPTGEEPKPPAASRPSELPFLALGWENFERLCRRLADASGTVEKAWAYGSSGYGQLGIDVLVRGKDGSYEVWQSKRYKQFGTSALTDAVEVFLKANWSKSATRFVLAVACNPANPKVIDALEKARDQLRSRDIAFEPLFATELTQELKEHPRIIDDFFGRAWVNQICSPEQLAELANHLSARTLALLPSRLHAFYSGWISTVDPGLPILGQGAGDLPAPELGRRYVIPDLLLDTGSVEPTEFAEPAETAPKASREAELAIKTGDTSLTSPASPPRHIPAQPTEHRVPMNQFLAEAGRVLITAEAGAGKTTLLRYLALQVLSEQPSLRAVRERYAGHLPVCVSFALWARMSEGKDHPPPLEDVVQAFFEALNDRALGHDTRRALESMKLLLLVDGLDETSDQAIADALVVSLTLFAERRGASVLATSRPHGIKALSGIGGSWTRSRLAPLSDPQKEELALLWYRLLERHELGPTVNASSVERQASLRAQGFMKALLGSPGISRLSQIPLFLLSLLKLHRMQRDLPRNRFDASREIVEQLMHHQPKRREIRVDQDRHKDRQRQRLLEDFAFVLHSGELHGSVADGAFEHEVVARAAKAIMSRTGTANLDYAEEQARNVFIFSEEVAGLLVKKSQGNIGFLHRSLQEYFVGSYLAQRPFAERLDFIRRNAATTLWKEPILYLLYLTPAEEEVGQLLEAIEQANARDIAEREACAALLAEATFADFAHDIPTTRRLASTLFAEAEGSAWGERQRALVAATVDGLFSQSLAEHCEAKLSEWLPEFHGYGRGAAITAIMDWDMATRPAVVPVLMRILTGEVEYVWRRAGLALGHFSAGDSEIRARLLELAHGPPSIDGLNAALFALGRGWRNDTEVGELARALRDCNNAGIQMDAIRIRAERGEADLSDLEIFASIAFQRDHFPRGAVAPDITSYFARTQNSALVAHLERALRNPEHRRFNLPLTAALVLTDPAHPMVQGLIEEILGKSWSFREIFERDSFPAAKVNWTPQLIKIVEAFVQREQHLDYELYWISKVLPLPFVKSAMLESMKRAKGLTFWSASGLAEGWGKQDAEVVATFREMLDAPAKALADVARELPVVLDDDPAVRRALLRGLREEGGQKSFLIAGLRRLGVEPDDEESFRAAFEAGDLSARSMYDDKWRGELINTFAARSDVRGIARRELCIRDGNIGVVAACYGEDEEMRAALLKVLAPLPQPMRLRLVEQLGAAAPSNAAALRILTRARHDTDGTVCGEATCSWTEAQVARGEFAEADKEFLVGELDAMGPEFDHRRAAAVVGLTMTDNLAAFSNKKDAQGKPLEISVAGRISLSRTDRYLRRILPFWDRLVSTLGSDEATLMRLNMDPPEALAILTPGPTNADRVFELLQARVGPASRMQLDAYLGAVRRFRPDGALLRSLIAPLLLHYIPHEVRRSMSDRWPEWMAPEIFAEHFAQSELRKEVVDYFINEPRSSSAAGALAETALRSQEPQLERLLCEKASGLEYDIPTAFRVMAVTATADRIVAALEWLLKEDPSETHHLACVYWVPALLRRVERDDALADLLLQGFSRPVSNSAKLSQLTLAGKGMANRTKARSALALALKKYEASPAPVVAFDVTADRHRLAEHSLSELLN